MRVCACVPSFQQNRLQMLLMPTFLCFVPLVHISAKCATGSYSPTGLIPCAKCTQGTYQPQQNMKMCIQCPPATLTPTTGSTALVDCQGTVTGNKMISAQDSLVLCDVFDQTHVAEPAIFVVDWFLAWLWSPLF